MLGQITFGATLTVLRGTVSVVHGNGTAVSPAPSGLKLLAGDRIATVGRAAALVTFFDGSEVELGADTTIALQEASGSGNLVTIIVETVLGSAVHHVATFTDPGSTYRVVANGTELLVKGTTVGHGVDPDGNVTAYLIESSGPVTFPNSNTTLNNGEGCTATSSGDLACTSQDGKDVWSGVADGVQPGGSGSSGPGNATSNTPKSDEQEAQGAIGPLASLTPTATPTPTGTLSPPIPTPTATPTIMATPISPPLPTPTATTTTTTALPPTGTATPTQTLTPTPTHTLMPTPTPTATQTPTQTPTPTPTVTNTPTATPTPTLDPCRSPLGPEDEQPGPPKEGDPLPEC